MLSTSANADAIADAAARKAMQSPKGSKREREQIAKKARLVALACNVRAHRMRITQELGEADPVSEVTSSSVDHLLPANGAGAVQETRTNSNTANPLGGSARSGEGS